ncbi:MAG: nicotinate (nicotinamide) nucleotide adenylyltransferase [Ruminococcaceae bacterium]|nr:nicotinate (nicotinamide) nucleotide adenylyltransferase [Oscillospiraceae bacterium]
MKREGIGIFGGSFDPVHLGHRKLALYMCEKLSLRKMLIMPAAVSPFKSSSGASSEERLQMCRLSFPEDIFEISSIETDRGGKSYTIDTVNAVKAMYPDEKIYLIIGSDQLLSFNRWYKFKEILSIVCLCAVSREDESLTEEMEKFADEKLREFGECMIFPFSPFVVSSTEIRSLVSSGEDAGKYLHDEVSDYILTKGLYKK